MQEYSHVLCLFCKTGKEQSVAQQISENGVGTAIFPQRISKRYSKERRGYEEIKAPLLPGYVFVYLPDEVGPVNWWSFSGVIRPPGLRGRTAGLSDGFGPGLCPMGVGEGREHQPREGRDGGRPD